MARRRQGSAASQLEATTRFILVGVASTAAYLLLYLLLRGALAAQAANAISLLLTAVANTAVNRRVTFGIRGRAARGPAPAARADRIRHGPRADLGRAGRAARRCGPAGPGRRTDRAGRGQPDRHAGQVPLYRGWVFRPGGQRRRPVNAISDASPGRARRHARAKLLRARRTIRPRPGPRWSACRWSRRALPGWAEPQRLSPTSVRRRGTRGPEELEGVLFGSLDASNLVGVDRTPASLWVMELSGGIRLQLVEPAGTAGGGGCRRGGRAVRRGPRWFGAPAALIAGAVLAVTPVATLMLRSTTRMRSWSWS